MIPFEQYQTIVLKLKQEYQNGQRFTDSLPSMIREAFYDNELTNSYGIMTDVLMEELFDEMYDEAFWFIYEWDGERETSCMYEGIEYPIKNNDDYFKWVKEVWYDKR